MNETQPRRRGIALTLWLVFLLVVAALNLFSLFAELFGPDAASTEGAAVWLTIHWAALLLSCLAIWRWKKSGLYGIIGALLPLIIIAFVGEGSIGPLLVSWVVFAGVLGALVYPK